MEAVAKLKVFDTGAGLGAALVARHFALLGAQVSRLVIADDPFATRYPAYATLHRGAHAIAPDDFETAAADADVIILGGEDHPDLTRERFDPAAIAARHPRAIVLLLDGGIDEHGAPAIANDLLAQARSGLCFEQFRDRPIAWAIPGPTYGMALQGLIGVWAALLVREDSGEGQVVHASLQHGAAMLCMPDRISFEREDDISLAKIPYDVRQLIYPCADGQYIQFAMQRPGALARVYAVLGIPGDVDPLDTGAKRPDADPRDFFGDFELFSRYVVNHDRASLLAALWENQLGADLVLAPGECWDDATSVANDIIATDATGTRTIGLPIKFTKAPADAAPLPPRQPRAAGGKPLEGLRVISLGTFIAGPYVSRALADLGADVIKVDSHQGDPNTRLYTAWVVSNSGKRSLVVDVKQPEGREILTRLCAGADMIYNNFRPGVAKRIGVDPDGLRHIAPHAVTLQCSAYGPSGPKATYPGLDPIAQAVTGLEMRAGGVANDPIWLRFPIVDYSTGALGSIALMIARYEMLRGGGTIDAEINLFNTANFLNSELVQLPDGSFAGAPFNGAEQLGCTPFERLYAASDGWIAVAAVSDAMAARLLQALGINAGPDENDPSPAIATGFARMRSAEALATLAAAQVWAEAVRHFPGAIDEDAAAVRAGLVAEVDDPHYGRIVSTAPMFAMSKSALAPVRRPPVLGENTRELLGELGYSPDAIADLHARRIVASAS